MANLKDVSLKDVLYFCPNRTIPSDPNEFFLTTFETKIDHLSHHSFQFGLSLKRGFDRCGHGFGGCDGLGGISGFNGLSEFCGFDGLDGFDGFSRLDGFDGFDGFSGFGGFVF